MKENWLDLLDEIRAIAQLGLNYSKDPYDLARYRKLLDLAADSYSEITGLDSAGIKERFSRELGYITPKVGVHGALIDEFRREADLEIEPVAMIGMYTRLPGQYAQPHTSIHLLYWCHYKGGAIRLSHESMAMEYRDPATITEWHKDHEEQARHAVRYRAVHTLA